MSLQVPKVIAWIAVDVSGVDLRVDLATDFVPQKCYTSRGTVRDSNSYHETSTRSLRVK